MILKNLCMILKTAPSKKAIKKCDACKNTQTNELMKNQKHPQKSNEVKTQHSSSKIADDMFCKAVAVHLKI